MAEKDLFSHLDEAGNARMVDVGWKAPTERVAVAEGQIRVPEEAMSLLATATSPKGDVLTVAKVAGIMACKQTSALIPLCHPLPVDQVDLSFSTDASTSTITVRSSVKTRARTGVEMEALTACSVALLTIYDMLKSASKQMVIGNLRLVSKSGGASGVYEEPASNKS